jgi:hypothetical protein
MGYIEFVLILIIPALIGSATAVGWLVFKSADRALGEHDYAEFEERVLDELDVLRARVDALADRVGDPRLPGPKAEEGPPDEAADLGTEGS